MCIPHGPSPFPLLLLLSSERSPPGNLVECRFALGRSENMPGRSWKHTCTRIMSCSHYCDPAGQCQASSQNSCPKGTRPLVEPNKCEKDSDCPSCQCAETGSCGSWCKPGLFGVGYCSATDKPGDVVSLNQCKAPFHPHSGGNVLICTSDAECLSQCTCIR